MPSKPRAVVELRRPNEDTCPALAAPSLHGVGGANLVVPPTADPACAWMTIMMSNLHAPAIARSLAQMPGDQPGREGALQTVCASQAISLTK